MSGTDWGELTGRVVIEACAAAPEDVVLYLGDDAVADALQARVRTLVRRSGSPVGSGSPAGPGAPVAPGSAMASSPILGDPPPGLSIICLNGWLRRLPPSAQRAVFTEAARLLPARGLLVVGDVMWSVPAADIDAPEQFGDALTHVQSTTTIEKWARETGFLPDLHRFGVGAAVLVAVRGQS
jgi:hypothetical protein